jgi:hypothetical protein
MKKILIMSLILLSIAALQSCGKTDETTSANTFSLKGSGS